MTDRSTRFRIWFRRGVIVSLLLMVFGMACYISVVRERARNMPYVMGRSTAGAGFISHSVEVFGKDQSVMSDQLRDYLDKAIASSTFGSPRAGVSLIYSLSIEYRSPSLILDRNAAEPLAHYKHITLLSISGAEIDEDALQNICDLDHIEYLYLTECKLPPDAWEILSQCENLTELQLKHSSIKSDEIESIRQALPGSKVLW